MAETMTRPPQAGMAFRDVVERLRGEQVNRLDLILDSAKHTELEVNTMAGEPEEVRLGVYAPEVNVNRSFAITPHAHSQIATHAGVPMPYYRRMLAEQPRLLVENIRTWWRAEPSQRLARIIDPAQPNVEILGLPRCRSWLSNSYRVLDNFDFMLAGMEEADRAGAVIRGSHVDDERLYIKVATQVEGELRKGDTVRFGALFSNSEVGSGSLVVALYVEQLRCTNGMVIMLRGQSAGNGNGDGAFRQIHLGAAKDEGILSPETVAKESEVVMAKVRDWARFALNPDNLTDIMQRLGQAQHVAVEARAKVAVGNIVTAAGMSQAEADAVLERYLREDDDTQLGLVAAVTRMAHETEKPYARRVELEQFGGRMMMLEGEQFRSLVEKPITDKEIERLFSTN